MRASNRRFREAMIAAVGRLDPAGEAAIQLSGGVDSATILAAQLARGVRPACVTWQVGDFASPDVVVATAMCRAFGLEHVRVRIPVGVDVLAADVRRIVAAIGPGARAEKLLAKSAVMCAHPYLYVAPELMARGVARSLWGYAAGQYYADSKGDYERLFYGGKSAWDDYRRDRLNAGFRAKQGASFESALRVAESHGHAMLDPYLEPGPVEVALSLTYGQLHSPVYKGVAVYAFPEFWAKGRWYREQDHYQVVSGLKAYHESLLASPYNRRGSRDLSAIYNDLAAETWATHRDSASATSPPGAGSSTSP